MDVTARQKAITLFRRVFNDAEKLDLQLAGDLVDALIDAARSTESAHTRALVEDMHANLTDKLTRLNDAMVSAEADEAIAEADA